MTRQHRGSRFGIDSPSSRNEPLVMASGSGGVESVGASLRSSRVARLAGKVAELAGLTRRSTNIATTLEPLHIKIASGRVAGVSTCGDHVVPGCVPDTLCFGSDLSTTVSAVQAARNLRLPARTLLWPRDDYQELQLQILHASKTRCAIDVLSRVLQRIAREVGNLHTWKGGRGITSIYPSIPFDIQQAKWIRG